VIIGFILCLTVLWTIGALARKAAPPPPDYARAILAVMDKVEEQDEALAKARYELDQMKLRDAFIAGLHEMVMKERAERAGIRLEIGQPVKPDEKPN
jgi:1,6-anhydro-N-acetylmuramate kinase